MYGYLKITIDNKHMSSAVDYIDLWIVAGQSNTDGRIELSKQRPSWLPYSNIVPNVKCFNSSNNRFELWKYSYSSVTLNNNEDKWAYDSTAMFQYANLVNKEQYVIKHSLGGSSIGVSPPAGNGQWNSNYHLATRSLLRELEDKYHSAMKVLNQKNKTIVLRGVLWHQGESDSNSKENENAYYHNLYSVIKKIREFTHCSNLPFIFATIPKQSEQFSTIINTAHFKLSKKKYSYIVDLHDGTTFDGIHFDGTTAERLGNDMLKIMASIRS
ncbi:hypothetical protein C0W96_09855 [Photobacterium kishitanii]|nr:hypothetical protein C0W96_09855 [Photobacterium kishitanii]PSV18253.1 hypothetical protein C0W59_03190 [Photobacterium kishitanii]PSV74849.1 hypothetical protein C0W29_14060 [Photobacterium kishitanii]